MADLVDYLMGVAIAAIIAAAVIPTALVTYFAVNTTTWDAGTAGIWGVIGIVIVAAVIKKFM